MKISREKIVEIASTLKFEVSEEEIIEIIEKANQMIEITDGLSKYDTKDCTPTQLMSTQTNVFATYENDEQLGNNISKFSNFDGKFFSIKKVRDDE